MSIKFKYFIFLFMYFNILSCAHTFAQEDTPKKAKVILTNGKVIIGTVEEWIYDEKIKLYMDDDPSVLVEIDFKRIKSIEFADVDKEFLPTERIKTKLEPIDPKGYFNNFSLGLLFGESETNYSVGLESGYRFNDHWALGIGTNYELYDVVTAIPVFVNGKYYLNRNNFVPFAFAGAGYGFTWFHDNNWGEDWLISEEKIKGGLFGQTGLGYQMRGKNLTMSFSLGYKFQATHLEYTENLEPWRSDYGRFADVEEKRTFRRIFFNITAVF